MSESGSEKMEREYIHKAVDCLQSLEPCPNDVLGGILRYVEFLEGRIKEFKSTLKVSTEAAVSIQKDLQARIAVLEGALKKVQDIECEGSCKFLSGFKGLKHNTVCTFISDALSRGSQ